MAIFYIDSDSEGILELTSTSNIQVRENSTPSKFKLETGETISDNVVVENLGISFSGIISNIQRLAQPTKQNDGNEAETFTDPVKGYIEAIRRIKNSKELFTVRYDSRFKSVPNCIITSITTDRDASSGLGYRISLSFEQIRISGRATTSEIRSIQRVPDKTQEETSSGSNNQKKVDLVGKSIFKNTAGFVLEGFEKVIVTSGSGE